MTDPERQALIDALPERLRPLTDDVSTRRIARCVSLLDDRLPGVVVVAEAVHRRHNISAILRSAEGFGVHEAHLITRSFKPSKGSAKGAERWMELHIDAETTPTIQALKDRGYQIYVADLSPDAVSPDAVPVDRPVALVFGAELAGVSDEARALADGVVCVPMRGVTQSLNVSAAAAVVLWAVCARARASGGPIGITGPRREAFIERFLRREAQRKQGREQLFGGPFDELPGEIPAAAEGAQ